MDSRQRNHDYVQGANHLTGIQSIYAKSKSKLAVTLEAAFQRGRKAFVERKSFYDVPYADRAKAEAWEAGYNAELKEKYGNGATKVSSR